MSALFLQKALEMSPYSYAIRTSHMAALVPRWGGSYEGMEKFAIESEKFLKQNPKLKLLRGYIPWDKGRVEEGNGSVETAIRYYTEAISYGDHWLFLSERGQAYYRRKEYRKALADLDRSLRLRPKWKMNCVIAG